VSLDLQRRFDETYASYSTSADAVRTYRDEILPRAEGSGFEVRRCVLAALIYDVIANLLAFIEALQARTFDRTDMDEHVLAAAIGLYKAEPLCGVEPLNRS
jgi:hypothetical protein